MNGAFNRFYCYYGNRLHHGFFAFKALTKILRKWNSEVERTRGNKNVLDVIYQTRETVFHQINKHREVGFLTHFEGLGYLMKHSFKCLI